MTFLELKTSVKRYIIDNAVSVDAEIDDVVNEALRAIYDRQNFKVYERKTSLMETTNITRKLADVPSDFKQPRGRPYIVDNLGNIKKLWWAPSEEEMEKKFTESDTTTDKGQPEFILIYSKPAATSAPYFEFHLFPFPDQTSDYANGNWRIICPYWAYPPVLTADGDTNFILNEYPLAIRFQCIAQLFWLLWDQENAATWEVKADTEIKKAKRADKKKQFASGQDRVLRIRGGVSDKFNAARR